MILYSGSQRQHLALRCRLGENVEDLWRAGTTGSARTNETCVSAWGKSAVSHGDACNWWRVEIGRSAARYQRQMSLQCASRIKGSIWEVDEQDCMTTHDPCPKARKLL